MLLGKMDNTKAIRIGQKRRRKHRHKRRLGVRIHRTQKVNLHWRRVWHPGKKYFVRLRLSTRGLKTIKRLGIIEAARRFHLNIDDRKLFAGFARLKIK